MEINGSDLLLNVLKISNKLFQAILKQKALGMTLIFWKLAWSGTVTLRVIPRVGKGDSIPCAIILIWFILYSCVTVKLWG